jgi:hypothetical protein
MSIDPFIYHVTTVILLACAAYAGFQAYEGRSSDWRLLGNAAMAAFLLGFAVWRITQ